MAPGPPSSPWPPSSHPGEDDPDAAAGDDDAGDSVDTSGGR